MKLKTHNYHIDVELSGLITYYSGFTIGCKEVNELQALEIAKILYKNENVVKIKSIENMPPKDR